MAIDDVASTAPLVLSPTVLSTSLPGWNHTAFLRRAPSALRGNPAVDTLTSQRGGCPLSTPRALHSWKPKYGPSGLGYFRNAYVVIDGLVVKVEESLPGYGRYHCWVGSGVTQMLAASGLATKDANNKQKLRVPPARPQSSHAIRTSNTARLRGQTW